MAPLQAVTRAAPLLLLALCALSSPSQILAVRLSSNLCGLSNFEYRLSALPASSWYYRGSGADDYCNANSDLSLYVCNVASSSYCSDETKAQTCARATYPATCNAASRVFQVVLDSDCDYVVTCEYRTTIPPVTSTPVIAPTTPSPTLPLATPAATAAAVSLAPKPGDVVVLTAYALGSAEYTCNSGNGYDNGTLSATLHSTTTGSVLGSLSSVLSPQGLRTTTFNLTNGTIVLDSATSRTFPSPSSILKDGGYGSLSQTYSLATGTLGFVAVRFATTSDISGGVLPANAPCPMLPFPTQTFRPWRVPYQATYNFFSTYTLP